MIIKEITQAINELAPEHFAEDFDNVGLIVGDETNEVSKALITLDTTEDVVNEAIDKGCELIISFHPIIFKGLKRLNPKDHVSRSVIKAIKNDVAIYATHTALDNIHKGTNFSMADQLGLREREILVPKPGTIKKLTTYIPVDDTEKVREALFAAGAGNIGNYDRCSFTLEGTGSFKGNEDSNPVKGERGVTQLEPENQLNITFPAHQEVAVLKALFRAHPYEEVAYEVETLENIDQQRGIGMIGKLPETLSEGSFIEKLKKTFQTPCIRHSRLNGKNISKVAVLGGSGAFAISNARSAGADAYVTADLKYHDFFQALEDLLLVDIGHHESEQFTKKLLYDHLKEKFPNFAPVLAETNTNPVQYT